jgi:PAS domain S-box-containing protein
MLATELQTLQHVASQLITAQGTEALYDQILDTALAILNADLASIQMFHAGRGTNGKLKLLAHRGFSAEAAKRWEWVGPDSRTTCGEALRTGRRVTVPDVRHCDFMAESEDLQAFLDVGIHAAQTLPLVSQSGELVGMVTTYWREPHELSESESRASHILARLAADSIERWMAEEALSENRQRLVSIYDTVKDVIFDLAVEPERQFSFVSVNAAFLKVTGLSREAVVGKTVNQVIPEPSLTMVLGKYRQAIEEHTTVLWEETSDYPTGRLTGEVCVTPIFDNTGTCTRLVGSVHDITERKRAEAALRKTEAHLVIAQRLANLGSWERDEETGNTEFSDEMLRILGMPEYPPPTLAEFLNYVHPEDRERVWEGALRARSTAAQVAGEYRIVRADSEVRFVRSVLQAIRNEHGEVIRVVGATQDITDFKRAQEESLAHQKLESVGTLAGGIAHDFNNLLGGVLAQAELALAELDVGSSCKEELKAIREVAIRGSEIVRQLMIYAGKESEVIGRVDLSKIVLQMLALLKVSVSKHAVMITDLAEDLPPIPASPAQLRQIVMNLITNASDAIGDRDGVIRVTTRCATIRESAAVSESLLEGDYLVLEVSDTGGGMSPETQSRVFDPFYTTKSAGHGLGLAVVSGIVRSLGRRIRITSELGKGSKFQVLLPCPETTAAATIYPVAAIEESVGPFRDAVVLIVEDEDSLRSAVLKMLRKRGVEVLEAANGSAAIDLLRANRGKIDVILLDMTIPGASSREVVAEAVQSSPSVKVVLTSAYNEEILTPLLSASQIRGFIRKPFQFEELVQTFRNVSSA